MTTPETIHNAHHILVALETNGIPIENIQFDDSGSFVIETQDGGLVGPQGIGGGTVKGIGGGTTKDDA